MQRTVTVDEVEERRAGDLLRQLAREGDTMTVVLETGETVVLHPVGLLKRLPSLEGRVPEGWKDAIYGP
jgi:hypothetical protein